MKEWSKKPTDFVKAGSSPVKTVSSSPVVKGSRSPASLAGGDLSKSPMKTASARVSLTSGGSSQSLMKVSSSAPLSRGPALSNSLMRTANSPMSLTGGGSSSTVSTVAATSSGSAKIGTGLAQRAAAGTAVVAPLAAGVMVGGISAVFYGISNMIKYGKSEKTGAQAAKDTVKGSAGLGAAAGLGVAAAHAVAGTSLALGTAVVVPVAAGIGVAYAGMKIWNKIFFKEQSPSKTKSKAK